MQTKIAVGFTAVGFVGLMLIAAQLSGNVLFLATVLGGVVVAMTYIHLMR